MIKRVNPTEFLPDALDSFDRHQVVRNVYRLKDGQLTLVPNPFEEDWSPERKREKAARCQGAVYFCLLFPGDH